MAFFLFTLCVLCPPETYAPVLLKKKAQRLRKTTGDERYWHPQEKEKIDICTLATKSLARPIKRSKHTLLLTIKQRMLCIELIVLQMALHASFTYGLLYLTRQMFPIVFNEHRSWPLVNLPLLFLSILVGVIFAVCVNLAYSPRYRKAAKKNNSNAVPEARLPPLLRGGFLLSAGLFWFGWTAAPKYSWPLSVVAGGKHPETINLRVLPGASLTLQ